MKSFREDPVFQKIIDKLVGSDIYSFITITAPAHYGKTTLVANLIEELSKLKFDNQHSQIDINRLIGDDRICTLVSDYPSEFLLKGLDFSLFPVNSPHRNFLEEASFMVSQYYFIDDYQFPDSLVNKGLMAAQTRANQLIYSHLRNIMIKKKTTLILTQQMIKSSFGGPYSSISGTMISDLLIVIRDDKTLEITKDRFG